MTHVLIVSASFYADLTDELIRGATQALTGAGVTFETISVPGAFEVPGAIRFAMSSKKYDGYIALGCVIRGETTHYDYICQESARGLMDLSMQHRAAIGYGILTVETPEQAKVRADVKQGNKGADAAAACLRMIELKNFYGVSA